MQSGKLMSQNKGLLNINYTKLVKWLDYLVPKIIKIDISMFLLFGLPIVGLLGVTFLLGCDLSAAGPKECNFLGFDIGERVYFYAIPFIGSILTPVAFAFAFYDILLVLNLPVMVFLVLYLIKKKQGL
jgi:hypothetical protein